MMCCVLQCCMGPGWCNPYVVAMGPGWCNPYVVAILKGDPDCAQIAGCNVCSTIVSLRVSLSLVTGHMTVFQFATSDIQTH
eukprot:3662356-Rhodomonas_salina.1